MAPAATKSRPAAMTPPQAGRWRRLQERLQLALAEAPPGARGVGLRLQVLRAAQHLTIAQLAEKIGVSHPTVRRWERGEVYPSVLELEQLARELGAVPYDLFVWTPGAFALHGKPAGAPRRRAAR